VLDQITPDIDISLSSIDPETRTILIKTDSGIVPIESVSQGTISVLCWVGVVLQRLYEVHGDLDDPEQGGALVIVDEVDAHMHPGWQQELAGRMRDLFPAAQIIATTHSPLMISSSEPEEVVLVYRSETGVKVERPHFDARGLRADQILTSPLFRLQSTRDAKTRAYLNTYTDLVWREDLNAVDQQRLEEAARALDVRLPSAAESTQARQAFAVLNESINEKVMSMAAEDKEELMKEVRVQLQEAVTGSKRPS
jgi:predicted ATP-binding protein involved in virulence